MSKLFILGNGFDLDHNLPTGYWHFREFLASKGKVQYYDYSDLFELEDGETAKYVLNQDKIIDLLMFLIDDTCKGEDWEDFVEATGNFYYEAFFDFCEENKDYTDKYYSLSDETYMEYEFDDSGVFSDSFKAKLYSQEGKIADQLNGLIPELKNLFNEWFNTIDTATAKKTKFNYLLNPNDLFLTFNYTNTLEEVYNIRKENICHIHGQQGGEIVFGHGQIDDPYNIDNQSNYSLSIYLSLSDLFNDFKKNTQMCYKKQEWFFNKLNDDKIDSIISFGFSFSEVDRYYIKKICEKVDTSSVVWHLTQFDEDHGKKEMFEKIIRECGFKGSFGRAIPDLNRDVDTELTMQKKVS